MIRSIRDLWETGNAWAHYALLSLLAWPILMMAVGLLGITWLTPLATMLPLAALVCFVLGWTDPLVFAIVWQFDRGRNLLKWFVSAVCVQLLIGIYLTVVPVGNDMALVPLVVLVGITLPLLGIVGWLKMQRALIALAVILTLIFLLGGRTSIKKAAAKFPSLPTVNATGRGTPKAPDCRYLSIPLEGEEEAASRSLYVGAETTADVPPGYSWSATYGGTGKVEVRKDKGGWLPLGHNFGDTLDVRGRYYFRGPAGTSADIAICR